jgi:DNA-directed RNA polymerase subunit E'/Rpb7
MEDLEHHVQSKLHKLLMKYNDDACGVLLSLSHLRLPPARRFASILQDLPFLHVQVEATALVFTPTPGSVLTGEVIKVTGTHVALLVHGLFNAAIAREDMPDAFEYVSGRGEWVCNGGGGREGRLTLGEQVEFRVVRVHEAAGLIALDGSMREEGGEPRESAHGHPHHHHHHHQQQQQEGGGGGRSDGRQEEQPSEEEEEEEKEEEQQQTGKRKAAGTRDQGEKKAKKQKKGREEEREKEKRKSKKKDKKRPRNEGDSSD